MTEQQAREAERKAIVEWVSKRFVPVSMSANLAIKTVAAAIERGEHLKGKE